MPARHEFAEGMGLNGDGDLADSVGVVLDVLSGVVNTLPYSGVGFLTGERSLLLLVYEGHPGEDLNRDGDLDRSVLLRIAIP